MSPPAEDAGWLEAADRIGAQLCRDAIWSGDRCNWMGPAMEFVDGRWQVVHRTSGADLYGGASGIGLFLAHLHARTGEPLFRRTAQGAMRLAFVRAAELRASPARAGVYSGVLGVVLAAVEVSHALGSEAPPDEVDSLLEGLRREGPVPDALDVVAGSAGAIPALLRLHGALDDPSLFDLAIAHGEALLGCARPVGDGLAWETLPGHSTRPLTGLAHGAAGIATALLELHHATRDARFREAGLRAIAYEQSVFSSVHDNWPDFRVDPTGWATPGLGTDGPTFGIAWCHGAAGIGLSRTRAFELERDPRLREQAEAALRTTRRHLEVAGAVPGMDASLCHGLTGCAELLLESADALGTADDRARVVALATELTGRYRDRPWPCGVNGGGETPGLFLGLAGIGWFILRLAPDPPPSILLVRPHAGTTVAPVPPSASGPGP